MTLLRWILMLLCCYFPYLAFSQVEKTPPSKMEQFWDRFEFNWDVGAYYQAAATSNKEISQHPFTKRVRKLLLLYNSKQEVVSDNPLMHGTMYLGMHGKADIAPGYSVSIGLIGEHRGYSYGMYNTENVVVFPQLKGSMNDTVTVFNQDFRLSANLGYLLNVRIGAGLTYYNVDAQGFEVAFGWRHLQYQYIQYTDFALGYGLNEEEPRFHWLSLVDLSVNDHWTLEVGLGTRILQRFLTPDGEKQYAYMSYFKFQQAQKNWEIYGQIGYRPLDESYPLFAFPDQEDIFGDFSPEWTDQSAFVFGASWEQLFGPVKWKNQLEFRYYGKTFNKDQISRLVVFRDQDNPNEYQNTVGENLYPIRSYDRPFSQWAVFTEFRDRNVFGLTSVTEIDWNVFKNFYLNAVFDLNYLEVEQEGSKFFPFYTAAAAIRLADDLEIAFTFTNKAMNLDLHYHTYYLLDAPWYGYRIRKRLPADW